MIEYSVLMDVVALVFELLSLSSFRIYTFPILDQLYVSESRQDDRQGSGESV